MALLGMAGAAAASSVMRIFGTDLPHGKTFLSCEDGRAVRHDHRACSLMLQTTLQRTAPQLSARASCTGLRQKNDFRV